jgi:hypothetical protein
MSSDELVELVAEALYEAETRGIEHRPWAVLDEGVSPGMRVAGIYRDSAEAAIETVRGYQAVHGAWTDAELNADWWVESPRAGEA